MDEDVDKYGKYGGQGDGGMWGHRGTMGGLRWGMWGWGKHRGGCGERGNMQTWGDVGTWWGPTPTFTP